MNRLESEIEKDLQEKNYSGCVVGVLQDDHISYLKAFGFAEKYFTPGTLLENPVPMTTDTVFDIASLTKIFSTAFLIELLKLEKKLRLNQTLGDFFPEIEFPITIEDLLRHTSGIAEWVPFYSHCQTPEEVLKTIALMKLKYPIGSGHHYSDLNFMLLGLIIEKIEKEKLSAVFKKKIAQKLSLTNTSFHPRTQKIAATSFGNPFEKIICQDPVFTPQPLKSADDFQGWREYYLKGEANDGNTHHCFQGAAGHAGLFSTTEDLLQIFKFWLGHGPSRDINNIFWREDSNGQGLGFNRSPELLRLTDVQNTSLFGHSGFTGTYAVGDFKQKKALVILTNRPHEGLKENKQYYNIRPLIQIAYESFFNS